jgi:hypothetical protein
LTNITGTHFKSTSMEHTTQMHRHEPHINNLSAAIQTGITEYVKSRTRTHQGLESTKAIKLLLAIIIQKTRRASNGNIPKSKNTLMPLVLEPNTHQHPSLLVSKIIYIYLPLSLQLPRPRCDPAPRLPELPHPP